MNVCFSDIEGIQSLTYAQLRDYTKSWETFKRVESYNSNVSTLRANGDNSLVYYQFPTTNDYSLYRKGQLLQFTYLGFSTTVSKD